MNKLILGAIITTTFLIAGSTNLKAQTKIEKAVIKQNVKVAPAKKAVSSNTKIIKVKKATAITPKGKITPKTKMTEKPATIKAIKKTTKAPGKPATTKQPK